MQVVGRSGKQQMMDKLPVVVGSHEVMNLSHVEPTGGFRRGEQIVIVGSGSGVGQSRLKEAIANQDDVFPVKYYEPIPVEPTGWLPPNQHVRGGKKKSKAQRKAIKARRKQK